MENYIILKNQIPSTWKVDEDGMLRCDKVAMMKSGVMLYYAGELLDGGGQVPDHLLDTEVRLYVPPEELASPKSLKTLEGVPASIDEHTWQIAGSVESKGNVSGKPVYDDSTNLVFSGLMITDPATIARITEKDSSADKLIDISAGYRNTTDWTPGVTPEGEAYDGVQRNIDYNHVILLRQGLGRGGEGVRIYNRIDKKRVKDMPEFATMVIGKTRIKVMNEDVDKLQNIMDEKDEKIDNAGDPAKLDETMSQLADLNKQFDEMSGQRDALRGQLQDMQNKMDAVLNPEAMASAVEDAVVEQQNAGTILNAYGAKEPEGVKKMFGHKLRIAVVNAVRDVGKKDPLSTEQAENEGFVKGAFSVMQEYNSAATGTSKTVNGASLIGDINKTEPTATAWDMTAEERKKRIYYREGIK